MFVHSCILIIYVMKGAPPIGNEKCNWLMWEDYQIQIVSLNYFPHFLSRFWSVYEYPTRFSLLPNYFKIILNKLFYNLVDVILLVCWDKTTNCTNNYTCSCNDIDNIRQSAKVSSKFVLMRHLHLRGVWIGEDQKLKKKKREKKIRVLKWLNYEFTSNFSIVKGIRSIYILHYNFYIHTYIHFQ